MSETPPILMENRIEEKLQTAFSPTMLRLENQSHMHAHHDSSPKNGQSHFHVMIISDIFENHTKISRQKLVYRALKQELNNGLHALSMICKTPQEHQNNRQ